MTFNRFYISIIIQVILIGLTSNLFVWTNSQEYMLITKYSLVILWIIQLSLLINYINRISKNLSKFLHSLKYNDATIKFDTSRNHPFRELNESFSEILDAFGKIRIEKEYEYQFFQTSIEHIKIGLIAFNEEGHINLCNRAALDLLGVESLVNISSLKKVKVSLPKMLKQLNANHSEILTLKSADKLLKLSLNATNLKIRNETIKLISIQNITMELEQGEMEAWQKLIRVITHEILNSVSPITLLSSGLINNFEKDGKQIPITKIDKNRIKESLIGLRVIQKRSKGLSAFVEDYRSSMQLPAPKFEQINIQDLFKTMSILFKEEFEQKNILFTYDANEKHTILGDTKLIEQLLINLINNAIHFIKNNIDSKIQLIAKSINQQTIILIIDNGQGIESDILDQIFIPFFSTKEKGSGIGLSLSRQIMRMHNGSISVQSIPSKETIFSLKF